MEAVEILRKIEELGREAPWFQCIDLGNGIKTKIKPAYREPVDNPQQTWNVVQKFLPDDLSGKTVLDIGCNAGFFSLEAKKRGAERVVGIDHSEDYLAQARFAAEVLQLDIEYQKMELYDLTKMKEKFDIVLCLGVLYHCRNLIEATEQIGSVVKDQIIIETLIWQPAGRFEKFILNRFFKYREKPLFLLLFKDSLTEIPSHKGRDPNWFAPNEAGLKQLLSAAGFHKHSAFVQLGERGLLSSTRS